MFWAQYDILWWVLGGLFIMIVVLVRMGVQNFNREELLGREIDDLNLYVGIRKLWKLTLARQNKKKRRSIFRWYYEEVISVIWDIRGAVAILAIALVGAYFIGIRYADIYVIPPDVFVIDDWYSRFSDYLVQTGLHGPTGILLVIGQNLRVLAVASVLATFTIGVLAILILMIPIALVGYLVSQMTLAGMDPVVLWAALIPHSLIEVPVAILAGAVAIRLGASVIASPPDKTIGEGWMEALADATRVWFTLILPLLAVAAITEVYLTPWLVSLTAAGR